MGRTPGLFFNFFFFYCLLAGFLFCHSNTSGQEMMGINGSNYAGTAGSHINPSSLSNFPLKWEIHLLTLDFFLDNNYAYMPKTSIVNLTSRIRKTDNFELQESDFVYSKTKIKNKSAYVNFMLKLPSVLFKIKDHRIAIINNGIRTVVSANKINFTMPRLDPASSSDSLSLDLSDATFSIPKFRINAMAWSEFGLSYSTLISKTQDRKINFGFTLKRLHGYLAGYFLNNEVFLDATDVQNIRSSVDFEYGYTDPTNAEPSYKGILSGKGMAIDIGTTIVMKGKYYEGGIKKVAGGTDSPLNYGLRVGVSLLDIGRINFDKNIKTYSVNEFKKVDSVSDLDFLINSAQYELPEAPQPGNSFTMRTPMALSVQADYKFRKRIFINGTWVQRIVLKGPGIDRTNQISITPRYELKWFGFSLPLVLYQYKYPRIGAALRIGPLWIGSDKIGSWFIPGKFSGTDIYISLRITPIKKPNVHINKIQRKKTPGELPCSFMPYKGTFV